MPSGRLGARGRRPQRSPIIVGAGAAPAPGARGPAARRSRCGRPAARCASGSSPSRIAGSASCGTAVLGLFFLETLRRTFRHSAGPPHVVGGRRRRARRDALAAGLAGSCRPGPIIAAGAPVAPVHEDGALPELRGAALARRLGGPAAPQALGAGLLGGLRQVVAQLPPARVPAHPCDGGRPACDRGRPAWMAGGRLPPTVSQLIY